MNNNDQLKEWVDKPLNAWIPENDPVNLAILGKFAEELSECLAIVSRCIIQRIEEFHPETHELNFDNLEIEIADVMATAEDTIKHFGMDSSYIKERKFLKQQHLARWRELIK